MLGKSTVQFLGRAHNQLEAIMDWVTPEVEVVELNCEISSYANAEL